MGFGTGYYGLASALMGVPQRRPQQRPNMFSGQGYQATQDFFGNLQGGVQNMLRQGGNNASRGLGMASSMVLGPNLTLPPGSPYPPMNFGQPAPTAGSLPRYPSPMQDMLDRNPYGPTGPLEAFQRLPLPVRQGLASMFRSGQPAPVTQPAPLTQPAPVAQRWPEVEEAGPMWNDAAASTAQGLPPMQTMIPMDAVLGMRQGTYQSPTFQPQTVKQRQSAGFFSMSPAAQAASMGGADAIGEQGLLQNSGVPGGYAQAGVNPGFGDRTGLAVHRAPLPQLNQLGAVADPVQAARDLANQRATASGLLRQESAQPPSPSSLVSGLSPAEWRAASKQRLTDAMAGVTPQEVGPWMGRMGERNISTTERLQQKAEDNPEGPEAAMLARMRSRSAERREGFQAPYADRRAMVTAKAQGRPLTPMGAHMERMLAAGEQLTPAQQAAAFGPDYAMGMMQYSPDVIEATGRANALTGLMQNPNFVPPANLWQQLMPGGGGMGAAAAQIPSTQSAEARQQYKDPLDYIGWQMDQGATADQAIDSALGAYPEYQEGSLTPGLRAIDKAFFPNHTYLSPRERLRLEYDARLGKQDAQQKLRNIKNEEMMRQLMWAGRFGVFGGLGQGASWATGAYNQLMGR